MQNIEVREEADGRLAFVIDPKQRGGKSKSGNSTIVATSHGNQTILTKAGAITIGLNAYVKE